MILYQSVLLVFPTGTTIAGTETCNVESKAQLCIAFPLLPSKAAEAKALAKTLKGPKRKEFEKAEKRLKTTKETWFLQASPQGNLVLTYFESKVPIAKGFETFARSKDTVHIGLKGKFKELGGIDFNNPPEGPVP